MARRRLRAGDPLPSEESLGRSFGVSRVSVREALRPLRHLGLLRSAPRRGLTLGELEPERLAECLDFHAAAAGYSDRELLRARMAIELGALPFAAAAMRADPALHGRLLAIVDAPDLAGDARAYLEADLAFHRELLAACGIGPLVLFERVLAAFFSRFRRRVVGPGRAGRLAGIAHHRRLLAALRDGRVDAARAELEAAFAHYEDATPERP